MQRIDDRPDRAEQTRITQPAAKNMLAFLSTIVAVVPVKTQYMERRNDEVWEYTRSTQSCQTARLLNKERAAPTQKHSAVTKHPFLCVWD